MIRQILADDARDDVFGAARRKRNDPVYRPQWIGLRPSEARQGRQRGSARGQIQKLPAGKFHSEPPSCFTSLDHLAGAASTLEGTFRPNTFALLKVDHNLG